MMDTYWLEGIRTSVGSPPKDERRTVESSNNMDTPNENTKHS